MKRMKTGILDVKALWFHSTTCRDSRSTWARQDLPGFQGGRRNPCQLWKQITRFLFGKALSYLMKMDVHKG